MVLRDDSFLLHFPGRIVKIRTLTTLAVALAAALSPASARSQTPEAPDSARMVDAVSGHDPTLRPGDVVQLRIWREPTMSNQYPVDEAGVVVFPLVGEYHVLEDTPSSLRQRLLVDYRKYLKNPSIEVTVLRRVRIMGSVNKPGLYPVDPTVTLADALAMAGGATPLGQPDKVRLIREGKQLGVNLTQDMRIADSPIQSGDELYVPERSWFSRNSNVVATSVAASVSLIIALFIRRN